MEQYIQCGDIAENPLYVKELGIHIYTAEEFCYYIFNNTYLLGEDFIRQEVIDFFRIELHMPELADKIVKFYGSSADMGAVLVMIMREIGYYEENQIQQFQNRLDRMNRQSLLERSKERGDLLLDKGRFECAVQIYSQTLQMPRDLRQKPQFYGQILQHMGVAYLRMGYADEAMECLEAAYAELKREEILEQMYYLALQTGKPFAKELECVASSQISRWQAHYMEVETRLQEQSEQETVVRSIGEDNEINLKISQDYLTQRKRAYCHMVMDD